MKFVKHYITALVFLGIGFMAHAQTDAIVKYFDEYMEDTTFSVIYISPKMFQLIAKIDKDTEDEDVKDVLDNLKGLRILSKDIDGQRLYKDASRRISTDDYDELMVVRDGNENITFWVKESPNQTDVVDELLMLVGGDGFTMISFVGKIYLNKIAKLGAKAEIKGLEHLEKINRN